MNVTKLFGNRILIEPLPAESYTPGGISIPERQVPKQPFGIVRMKGSGTSPLMDEVTIGDKVRVDHHFGSQDVTLNGRLHRIHSISDVQVVVG